MGGIYSPTNKAMFTDEEKTILIRYLKHDIEKRRRKLFKGVERLSNREFDSLTSEIGFSIKMLNTIQDEM